LGLEDQLVGRSHECDYPASVTRLPVCTAPKFDVHGSSRQIDERVKSLLQDATSVYRVDVNLLRELRPEVILTQTQCEVCAVSQKDVDDALCSWLGAKPIVVSLAPNALVDVWADIQRAANALGVAQRGKVLVQGLKARIDDVAKRALNVNKKPTVACLEWLDPLMAAGNWMPELVELAGGVNLFGEAGKHSPWMQWQDLLQSNPEIIVALPCGYDLPKTRAEMIHVTSRGEWPTLRAVKNGRVYVTDGNQYFNRPGPRLVESLEILAEILHPDALDFGHRPQGWDVLEAR
jgi:iron complex transport system substrate-binding protein